LGDAIGELDDNTDLLPICHLYWSLIIVKGVVNLFFLD